MALPLPGGVDPDPARQQKFDALARAMPGFGGQSVEIRYGTSSLTFPGASDTSNSVTVAHGLGRAPTSVQITGTNGAGTGFHGWAVESTSATNFIVRCQSVNGSLFAAGWQVFFYWTAIG